MNNENIKEITKTLGSDFNPLSIIGVLVLAIAVALGGWVFVIAGAVVWAIMSEKKDELSSDYQDKKQNRSRTRRIY